MNTFWGCRSHCPVKSSNKAANMICATGNRELAEVYHESGTSILTKVNDLISQTLCMAGMKQLLAYIRRDWCLLLKLLPLPEGVECQFGVS